MTKLNLILITGISIFGLLACNTDGNDKKVETKIEAELTNTFNSEEYDFVLPQPISLAKAFQASGLAFYPNLTNPVANKVKYNEKVKQLLNLGLYSTDLAYCAINGKSQDARNYLKAVQELGNAVGLKPVFSDKKLVEKFDDNLDNMEAVENLIYDIQERSEEYMQDNDIRYLSIVQFSGSWTEGMYLGVKDLEFSKKPKTQLSITLVDQMNLLKNIIKGIKTYPTNDPTLTTVSTKLTAILDLYTNLESVKKANAEKSFVTPILSDAEYNRLAAKIIELRNFITQ